MDELQTKFDALQAENTNLKQVIEQYQANKQAVESTIQELLAANINFKASEFMSAGKINRLQNEIVTLKAEAEKTVTPVVPAAELTDAA